MSSQVLRQIEHSIAALPYNEQLLLIEQVAHRLRESAAHVSETKTDGTEKDGIAAQLSAMAADPQIRAEIEAIEREFRSTEGDGLERA